MRNIFILLLFYYLAGVFHNTYYGTTRQNTDKVASETASEADELFSGSSFYAFESELEFSEDQDSKHIIISPTRTYRSFSCKNNIRSFIPVQRYNTNKIPILYTNLPPPVSINKV